MSHHVSLWIFVSIIACRKSAVESSTLDEAPPSSKRDEAPPMACGDVLAAHNGVAVYRNYGKGIHSCGNYHRAGGYDYGPKWQCVEFVRRYYKEHLNHRFPQKGNATDYFDYSVPHGQLNPARGLIQYRNGIDEKPKEDDLLVCKNMAGGYGHVAIIKKVEKHRIQILQQNNEPAEEWYNLHYEDYMWTIEGGCDGFLRKED